MGPARISLARFPACAALVATLGGIPRAYAQRPDSTVADSLRRADSLALVRELERGNGDSTPGRASPQAASGIARLLPDLSVVGDLVADASPDGSTQEDGNRFSVREIELGAIAAVDPYFRGTVYLGVSDAEGLSIEQAYLTTTALPGRLEGRAGRILMPVGKLNTTHRHDLHTVEFPHAVQRFLGEEALKGTGLYLSRVLDPFGFYQEIQASVVERFGEAPAGLLADRPPSHRLSGLGYSVRLRNYVDLTAHANLEISASAVTGRREQPLATFSAVNAVNARQSLLGLDVTYRWRPLQQGLYRSLIVQAELFRQLNERRPQLPPGFLPADYLGPTRGFTGGYVFARYQISRRGYLGGRYDVVQDPEAGGATLRAGSGYVEFFPSEFSKIVAALERVSPGAGGTDATRLLLQATFAMGPHRPHPF